jgi:hypothetical protein
MLEKYVAFKQWQIKKISRVSLPKGWLAFWRQEQGDLVGALGWMAITAVMLVAISAVLSGKMTSLVNSIFTKLEGLLV